MESIGYKVVHVEISNVLLGKGYDVLYVHDKRAIKLVHFAVIVTREMN